MVIVKKDSAKMALLFSLWVFVLTFFGAAFYGMATKESPELAIVFFLTGLLGGIFGCLPLLASFYVFVLFMVFPVLLFYGLLFLFSINCFFETSFSPI